MGDHTFRRRASSGDIGSGAMVVAILRFSHDDVTEVRARQSGKQPPAEKVECIIDIELQYPTWGEPNQTPLQPCLRYFPHPYLLSLLPAIGHNGIALRPIGQALSKTTLPPARHLTHIALRSLLHKNNRDFITSPLCHPVRASC